MSDTPTPQETASDLHDRFSEDDVLTAHAGLNEGLNGKPRGAASWLTEANIYHAPRKLGVQVPKQEGGESPIELPGPGFEGDKSIREYASKAGEHYSRIMKQSYPDAPAEAIEGTRKGWEESLFQRVRQRVLDRVTEGARAHGYGGERWSEMTPFLSRAGAKAKGEIMQQVNGNWNAGQANRMDYARAGQYNADADREHNLTTGQTVGETGLKIVPKAGEFMFGAGATGSVMPAGLAGMGGVGGWGARAAATGAGVTAVDKATQAVPDLLARGKTEALDPKEALGDFISNTMFAGAGIFEPQAAATWKGTAGNALKKWGAAMATMEVSEDAKALATGAKEGGPAWQLARAKTPEERSAALKNLAGLAGATAIFEGALHGNEALKASGHEVDPKKMGESIAEQLVQNAVEKEQANATPPVPPAQANGPAQAPAPAEAPGNAPAPGAAESAGPPSGGPALPPEAQAAQNGQVQGPPLTPAQGAGNEAATDARPPPEPGERAQPLQRGVRNPRRAEGGAEAQPAGQLAGQSGDAAPEAIPTSQPGVLGFTTDQGSTYTWGNGQSQRTKAPRAGHADSGLKEKSEKTVFLDPSHAREVGMWQTMSGEGKRIILRNGQVVLTSLNAKTGERGSDGQFPFTADPAVGRSPLELWGRSGSMGAKGFEAYKGNHPGSQITELRTTPAVPAGEPGVLAGGGTTPQPHAFAVVRASDGQVMATTADINQVYRIAERWFHKSNDYHIVAIRVPSAESPGQPVASAPEVPAGQSGVLKPEAEVPADAVPNQDQITSGVHRHPAQAKVPALARGWLNGEDAHWETYPEPLRESPPNGKPLELPPHQPTAEPLVREAWDLVSQYWPEMAKKVKGIAVLRGSEFANTRAAMDTNSILRVPEGKVLSPDFLWHELVHVQQREEGRLPRHKDRTDAQHIEIEREAYSRQAQMRAVFGETGKPASQIKEEARTAPQPRSADPMVASWQRELDDIRSGKGTFETEGFRSQRIQQLQTMIEKAGGPKTYNAGKEQGEGAGFVRSRGKAPAGFGRPASKAELAERMAQEAEAPIYAEQQARGVKVPPPSTPEAHPSLLSRGKKAIAAETRDLTGQAAELQQKTFPRTTRLNREAGEALARLISNPQASQDAGKLIADDVLGKKVDEPKERRLYAAFVEERLRHIHEVAVAKGQEHEAASLVGQEHSPLQTEQEFQDVLKDPEYQATYGENSKWTKRMVPEMENNFRRSEGMDDDDPIKSETQIPGRPMNLQFYKEGETPGEGVRLVKSGLSGIRQAKLGAARQATGQSNYDIDARRAIARAVAKGRASATKNEAIRALQEGGLGVPVKPGEAAQFGEGQPGVEVKDVFKQGHYVDESGDTPAVRRANSKTSMAVHPEIFDEVNRAFNGAEAKRIPFVTPLMRAGTWIGLQGTAEVGSHTFNLGRAQFAKEMRPQEFRTEAKKYLEGNPETMQRLLQLTEIGAGGRMGHEDIGLSRFAGKFLGLVDHVTRLQLDNAFNRMVEKGLVPDTETNRRDFVNQYAGQYNRLAQHFAVRWARDIGVGPFATAGVTQYMRTLKNLVGSPGVEATTTGGQVRMRITQLAKTAAIPIAAAAAWNYIQTGRVDGDDQTPIGAMYLGKGPSGETRYWDPLSATGIRRGIRSTGESRDVERLHGLVGGRAPPEPEGGMGMSRLHGIASSATHPFLGPPSQAVGTLMTGRNSLDQPLVPEHLKPGQGRFTENAKAAASQLNPAIATFTGKDQPYYAQKQPRTWGQWGYKMLGPLGFGERKPYRRK